MQNRYAAAQRIGAEQRPLGDREDFLLASAGGLESQEDGFRKMHFQNQFSNIRTVIKICAFLPCATHADD